jgi:hypothetical protein
MIGRGHNRGPRLLSPADEASLARLQAELNRLRECQPARKRDPRSASKRDPV